MTVPEANKHHHRSALKQNNKAFKGTTAAKRAELHGKLFKNSLKKRTGVKQVKDLSKQDRLNKAQLLMENKRAAMMQDARVYAGPNGLPRALSFIPLTQSARAQQLPEALFETKSGIVYNEKQKRRFHILPTVNELSDHLAIIDRVSSADTVIFVVDCTVQNEQIVSEEGLTALSVIRANGFSSAMIVMLEDSAMPLKKRRELEDQCKSFFSLELPNVETFFTMDHVHPQAKADLFLFTITNLHMKGISWRQLRPYMIIESIGEDGMSIMGHVRGGSMNANQAVAIPGVCNHLTISSVTLMSSGARGNQMQTDGITAYPDQPECNGGIKQMTTNNDNEESEQSMVDHEMTIEQNKTNSILAPSGTSSYQAAWIAEESDEEEDSEDENIVDEEMVDYEEESEELEEISVDDRKSVKFADTEDVEMDQHGDETDREALQSHRESNRKQFPDEIEIDEDGSARDRLIKYRAVKSLRTSEWDLTEGLPQEYSSVCAFQNYKLTRKRACSLPDSPFTIGSRVMVKFNTYIGDVIGRTAFFLLPHEHMNTVLNFTVKRTKTANGPILSKEKMLLVAGPRRLWINPIFSEHTSNQQLHKLLRELPEDGIHVGTCYGPVTFDPCPIMLLREGMAGLELILTGSILSNDPNRVILKRVTLTGTPFKIHKRIVVVRFMFFNAADVNYFKPVELMTKLHRRGHIKESLGTHGYMKCMFNKQIQHHDTVFMHLFKRVFPKHYN